MLAATLLLVFKHTVPIVFICKLNMRRHHTAMSPDLFFLHLNEALRTLLGDGFLVAEDEQWCMPDEYAIDIFERAACGFGIEEIYLKMSGARIEGEEQGELTYRDEREVENTPDDVEFPMEALDTGRRDLDDWTGLLVWLRLLLSGRPTHKVEYPVCRRAEGGALRPHRHGIDFRGIELRKVVSVVLQPRKDQRTQGTPCHPMPKNT